MLMLVKGATLRAFLWAWRAVCAVWNSRVALQHFGGSILAAIVLPLSPLLAEHFVVGSISVTGWMVTAIVFCASLAVYTQNALIIVASFIVIMGLAFIYGLSIKDVNEYGTAGINGSIAGIVFYTISHLFYRFDLHVTKGNDFMKINGIGRKGSRK